MTGTEMLEYIEEAVNKMVEYGNPPYAIICSKKTFEIIAKTIRKLDRFRELDNIIPQMMWFKYDSRDIPFIKHKHCPVDRIHIVDEDTYKRIMKEEIE